MEDFFRSIIGKCYHYHDELAYPHGRTKSIRPYRYVGREKDSDGGTYMPYLSYMISFTDGYIGDYTFSAYEETMRMFKSLKRY